MKSGGLSSYDLIKTFKAGKLVQIRASDNATLNIQMNAQEQLADISILNLTTTPYSFEPIVTANDATHTVENTAISHFTVTDTAEHISAHWSELESALTNGKLTSVSVSDGGIVTIPDLMSTNFKDATALTSDGSFWLSPFRPSSLNLLNVLHGMSALNIVNNLTDTVGGNHVIPTNLWSKLANLHISVPIHLLSTKFEGSLRLSVHDLLALQYAIVNNVIADFNINGVGFFIYWYLDDFNAISLIKNNNIFNNGFASGNEIKDQFSYTFSASEVHGMIGSKVFQAMSKLYFTSRVIKASSSHIADTASAINTYLDDIAYLLKTTPSLFLNNGYVQDIIKLTNSLPPSLIVTTLQIATDEIALNAITQSYLLSVQDSSSSLNNLDLTKVSNHQLKVVLHFC